MGVFDFYGGIVAGLGLNIFSEMITTVNNLFVISPITQFILGGGLIISGILIAVSRAVLGRINEIAIIKIKEDKTITSFEKCYKEVSKIKGLIALVFFCIGIILSVLFLTKIFFIAYKILHSITNLWQM